MDSKPIGDKNRRVCPSCDYIHFTDPKVGVGVMVIDEGRILLVKRAMNPEKGKWSIPAGFLDYGEEPQVTAMREVFEETNLTVNNLELMEVYHNPRATVDGGASIFILYSADLIEGTLMAGDDAEVAAFFAPEDLPELAFASTQEAIRNWQNGLIKG
jgi:ADP-ribose pyrophosphatase YjhB (NUDIX family)